MQFTIPEFPCGCVVVEQSGGTFTVSIDRTLITQADAGTRTIDLTLLDDGPVTLIIPVIYNLPIEIEYIASEGADEDEAPEESTLDQSAEGGLAPEEEEDSGVDSGVPEEEEEEVAVEEEKEIPAVEIVKEEDNYESVPAVPKIPPVLVFRAPGAPRPPPRKNVPVAIVEYNNLADKFAKTEPTLRKTDMNKKGTVGMKFSEPMEFPEAWVSKFENDKQFSTSATGRRLGGRKL